jgi:hypothetical protein
MDGWMDGCMHAVLVLSMRVTSVRILLVYLYVRD